MPQEFEWDRGLLSIVTAEFDRALQSVRRTAKELYNNPSHIADLAKQLKDQPGITRREFDRRFRLIVAAIVKEDTAALQAVARTLRDTSPEALNAVRALLPPELRHLAVTPQANPPQKTNEVRDETPDPPSLKESSEALPPSLVPGSFCAVALIGTTEEHVRNKSRLKEANLDPLPVPNLDQLFDLVNTGLCGFVVGGSAWSHVKALDQRRAVRRLCEYSTFLFVRVCVDGLNPAIAQTFSQDASDARCGRLDGKKFCHGQDCDLTQADIGILQSTARFLENSGAANFYPLGLSETDATLLRLIAADRRHPGNPVTIYKLGTRELAGGGSGARVFLLHDGNSRSFVVKVNSADLLTLEHQRYTRWIADWDAGVTDMSFHIHLKSAALSYHLQAAPDAHGEPAPTLDDQLERLRLSEWVDPIEKVSTTADDLFQALSRAIDRLAILNSRRSPNDGEHSFWLDRPVRGAIERGIDIGLLNEKWEPLMISELIDRSMKVLEPNLSRGIIHGDLHGRNILLLDRIPVFIDFALSGPGHPLEDLVRLDAIIRSACLRMLTDEHTMREILKAIYIEGQSADTVLNTYPQISVSPLTCLSVRTAIKVREASLQVGSRHSLGLIDLLAMTCVNSGHILVAHNPGSGIERVLLSVIGGFLRSKDS